MRYLLIFLLCFQIFNSTALTKIYIAQIVQHPALDKTRQGIIDELNANYCKQTQCEIKFDDAQGNILLAAQVANKYKSKNPDVAVGIGTTISQALKNALKKTNTKIVFSSVTDPVGADLVINLIEPNKNITGVSNFIPIKPQLQFYTKLLPSLKNLGMIYNPSEANSVKLVEIFKKEAELFGINIITTTANKSSDISTATNSIITKVDAILVSNDNTALSAFHTIVKIANKYKKPVFVSDTDMVELGAIGALGPDQYELGRQTGKMVTKLLEGQQISKTPVEFPEKIIEVIGK